jgi:hypothetical protein
MALSLISFEAGVHHIPDPKAQRRTLDWLVGNIFSTRTLGIAYRVRCLGNRTGKARVFWMATAIQDALP